MSRQVVVYTSKMTKWLLNQFDGNHYVRFDPLSHRQISGGAPASGQCNSTQT